MRGEKMPFTLTKKERIHFIGITVVILAIFIALTAAYVIVYDNSINEDVERNIDELSTQQAISINTYLTDHVAFLTSLAGSIGYYSNTTQDVLDNLYFENQFTGPATTLMLIDEKGNVYYPSGEIVKMPYEAQIFEINKDKDAFIVRYDTNMDSHAENYRQQLMYGKNIDMTIDGVHYVGVMLKGPLSDLESSLSMESFDGEGYTSLIDSDGNYLFNKNFGSYSYTKRINLFDAIASGEMEIVGEKNAFEKAAAEGKGLSTRVIYHQNGKTDDHFINIQPLGLNGWYSIVEVPTDVYYQQSNLFKFLTITFLSLVCVIFILLIFIIRKGLHATTTAKAEAKARFEFLSNMSHEIRTPLNGIIGLIQISKLHKDNLERINENIEKMDQSAQYLLNLVNDILDVSKLEAGKVELSLRPVSFNEVIDHVISIESNVMEKHGIHFITSKTLPCPDVITDERAVKQILINILGNAAKFTPNDGSVSLIVTQEKQSETKVVTRFVITDTGCGMSREFCEKIFDEFSQDRSANASSQKGTGLGMAIALRLAKAMNGDILVESEVGVGTTFTVVIPSTIVDENEVKEATAVRNSLPEIDKEKLHILLAEDNEINAEILLELFEDVNIPVDHALNGEEAVKKFSESEPGTYNVILMDIQMPIMDGYQATRTIRALDRIDAKSVYIFACTANSFEEDKKRAMESGMNDFITKPIDIRLLMDKLNAVSKK